MNNRPSKALRPRKRPAPRKGYTSPPKSRNGHEPRQHAVVRQKALSAHKCDTPINNRHETQNRPKTQTSIYPDGDMKRISRRFFCVFSSGTTSIDTRSSTRKNCLQVLTPPVPSYRSDRVSPPVHKKITAAHYPQSRKNCLLYYNKVNQGVVVHTPISLKGDT